MPQHKGNNPFGLAQTHQLGRTFAHLADSTGGGGKLGMINGLNGIQHQHIGADIFHGLNDILNIGFAMQKNIGVIDPQPLGAARNLADAFLAGDIQHF